MGGRGGGSGFANNPYRAVPLSVLRNNLASLQGRMKAAMPYANIKIDDKTLPGVAKKVRSARTRLKKMEAQEAQMLAAIQHKQRHPGAFDGDNDDLLF